MLLEARDQLSPEHREQLVMVRRNSPLDLVFRKARTYNAWLLKPIPDELLRQLYDTMKWAWNE